MNSKSPDDFRALSHSIVNCADRGEPKADFLRQISELLLEFSGCDTVDIAVKENGGICRCTASIQDGSFQFEITANVLGECATKMDSIEEDELLKRLRQDVMHRSFDSSLPFFTPYGSFWTGSFASLPALYPALRGKGQRRDGEAGWRFRSLAIIPIVIAEEVVGRLQLCSRTGEHFIESDISRYEIVAQTLGIALSNQRAQAALRERVKELTCLYDVATLSSKLDVPVEQVAQEITNLLPGAWQYPEITRSRIVLDDCEYRSSGFTGVLQTLVADIMVNGTKRGFVEVGYTKERPGLDEGPFLKEHRNLINAVATQIALVMERRQADEDRFNLQDQLRHADRLATIGQLAAGVAHELNEPLGNILGFAQLAKKSPDLGEQTSEDIERIVNAALHAREVVKKLMLFSRQMPTRKTQVNLNKMIREGLYFLESRCVKLGIEMKRVLGPDVPEITADPSQLFQVLVNLAVNAIQAMPDGGTLTLKTRSSDGYVFVVVEDTGIGMSDEVVKKIFIPFFTTKDIDEGTGLGLSVVHGIVTSHGGNIKVESEVGKGSRFEIQLPVISPDELEENRSYE